MYFKNNSLINKNFVTLTLFITLGWFLLSYRILDVPPGINGDEAIIGYNAALIAKNGYDSMGKFLPLFTKVPDSQDWKQPVTLYSTVIAFKLFGSSFFTLRIVSVVTILASGVLMFFLIKNWLGFSAAVWVLILYMTTPIVFIQSHLALENIAPIPFVILWLVVLNNYVKRRDKKFLLIAGLILGSSIFSYLGMRLIVPVLSLMTACYICYLNYKKREVVFKHLLLFILGIIPPFILLLLSRSSYPGAVLGLYRTTDIQNYQSFFLPFLSTFDPSFLYILGDATPYHSSGRGGMLLLASLPLFIFGIINIIRKKDPFLILCLITFLLMPVLFGLGSTVHRASRLLSEVPLYIIISTFGFLFINQIKVRFVRYSILTIILLTIFLNFIEFTYDYWYQYPQRVRAEFARPIHVVFDKAYLISKENHFKVYIQKDFFSEKDFTVSFLEQGYFPQGSVRWSSDQDLQPKSLLIADPNIIPGNLKKNLLEYNSGLEGFSIFTSK
jgi:hypothetical protein